MLEDPRAWDNVDVVGVLAVQVDGGAVPAHGCFGAWKGGLV